MTRKVHRFPVRRLKAGRPLFCLACAPIQIEFLLLKFTNIHILQFALETISKTLSSKV